MLKHLAATYLKVQQDYVHDRYTIVLPPGVTLEDLFVPTFWAHHTKRLRIHTIVRCIAEDGSFDLDLTVSAVPAGNSSIIMRLRPNYGGMTGEAAVAAAQKSADDIRLKEVPFSRDGKPVVRVKYLAATNWRVLGLEGREISRDHKTHGEAIKSMTKYLTDARLEMPSDAAIASSVEAVEKVAKLARAK